jgi:hypothetical protein
LRTPLGATRLNNTIAPGLCYAEARDAAGGASAMSEKTALGGYSYNRSVVISAYSLV